MSASDQAGMGSAATMTDFSSGGRARAAVDHGLEKILAIAPRIGHLLDIATWQVGKHGFEGREIAMDIRDEGYTHGFVVYLNKAA